MSIKKKIFRINIIILTLGMFLSAIIATGFLFLVEDAIEKRIEARSSMKLDDNVTIVAELLEQRKTEKWSELQAEVGIFDYYLTVYEKGEIVYQSDENKDKEETESIARTLLKEKNNLSGTELYFQEKNTYVGNYNPERDLYILAAHFSSIEWWESLIPIVALIVIGLLSSMAAVFFMLSSIFSWKMNRMIMKPLTVLLDGTQRIRKGELDIKLNYKGESEFEEVCCTFNDMAQKMLEDQQLKEKNEQARIDMVTGISHDLRTPLTSIQGYIKGILDGVANTPEKKEAYLRTAYEATEEMNILLQKLFEFSKMESGQMVFHMTACSLTEYTLQYISRKEKQLQQSGVVLEYQEVQKITSDVDIDIEQIKRIYDNLLENSIKYAMVTPVHIKIQVTEEGNETILQWWDNGVGVPDDKIDKIFERFYRCDESRNTKGSGVGLYVVAYIMKMHNGYVTVENDHGLKIKLHFLRRC